VTVVAFTCDDDDDSVHGELMIPARNSGDDVLE
jgi:hypothetical protein